MKPALGRIAVGPTGWDIRQSGRVQGLSIDVDVCSTLLNAGAVKFVLKLFLFVRLPLLTLRWFSVW